MSKESLSRNDATRLIVKASLASGARYAEAADAAGVSRRSVARWMSDPGFAREVSEMRAEQVSMVSGRLNRLAVDAVSVLSELMQSEEPAEALKAAGLVLQWASRMRTQGELENRLAEVERRLDGRTEEPTEQHAEEEADPDPDLDLDLDQYAVPFGAGGMHDDEDDCETDEDDR